MRFCLLATAALLISYSAKARLGETVEEVSKRYGEQSEKQSDDKRVQVATYHFNGLDVEVAFLDGKSSYEAFSKVDGTWFSEAEIETILGANAGDDKWEKTRSFRSGVSEWNTKAKNHAYSILLLRNPILVLETDAFMEWRGQRKATREIEKLKGI